MQLSISMTYNIKEMRLRCIEWRATWESEWRHSLAAILEWVCSETSRVCVSAWQQRIRKRTGTIIMHTTCFLFVQNCSLKSQSNRNLVKKNILFQHFAGNTTHIIVSVSLYLERIHAPKNNEGENYKNKR